jgi:hypothetical protein
MLHQYLQAEVVNSKAAWDILMFLDRRTKDLIKEALETLDGSWVPEDDEQPVLKSEEKVYKIVENSEGIIVYMCLSNETCSTTRPLESDRWCSEDLVTILEAMHTE